jgi:hypothetical protein
MFLVLTNNDDPTAMAVYRELCARQGADSVALLTDEELSVGTGWSYTHDDNITRTTLRLRDGRSFSSEDITAVFNRLRYLNGAHFVAFDGRDREYAVGEMFALLMSWLTSLKCPVVNPAGVRGFSFSNRTFLEWFKLAGEVDLPTRAAHFTTDARLMSATGFSAFQPLAGMTLAQVANFPAVSSSIVGRAPTVWLEPIRDETQRLLVVGSAVIGEPKEMAGPCLALAERSDANLMEFIFVRSSMRQEDDWRCGWINPLPQLSDAEVSAVTSFLEAG